MARAFMAETKKLHWQRLSGRIGDVAYAVTQVQFSHIPQATWRPAVNAFRCRDGMLICVDLAGVDREQIHLQISSRRLVLSGHLRSPEPEKAEQKAVQILAMEIDSGGFERELELPIDIDPDKASATQSNGLLWIELPARSAA